MKKAILLFAILFVWLYPVRASAYIGLCCGKCGGNMPMNIVGAGVPETNEFRFKVSPMFMRMDGLRDGTSSVGVSGLLGGGGTPSTPGFMAAPGSMDMFMTNVAAGYSFTDDFFGGLMFMWKDYSMPMKFNAMMRSITGRSGFTMESSGMGDTMLMTKYRLFTDDPLVPTRQASLFLGLSLPTGSIGEKNETHPVKPRQSEQLPYAMQLGSGTFDPVIGVVYQGSASPWWWGANAIYTFRLYDNARDYNLGGEFRLDLFTMYQFRYDLVAQVQLNGRAWGAIEGEMDEAVSGASGRAIKGDPASAYMTPLWDPDNYGGNSLLVTAGVQWQPIPLHILDLSVSVPAYQDLNGPQLEEDYRVMVTWYVEVPTSSSVRYRGKKKQGKSRLGF